MLPKSVNGINADLSRRTFRSSKAKPECAIHIRLLDDGYTTALDGIGERTRYRLIRQQCDGCRRVALASTYRRGQIPTGFGISGPESLDWPSVRLNGAP